MISAGSTRISIARRVRRTKLSTLQVLFQTNLKSERPPSKVKENMSPIRLSVKLCTQNKKRSISVTLELEN